MKSSPELHIEMRRNGLLALFCHPGGRDGWTSEVSLLHYQNLFATSRCKSGLTTMKGYRWFWTLVLLASIVNSSLVRGTNSPSGSTDGGLPYPDKFTFQVAIPYEQGVTRRDPSDVIKVGDTYYLWYSKVTDRRITLGNTPAKVVTLPTSGMPPHRTATSGRNKGRPSARARRDHGTNTASLPPTFSFSGTNIISITPQSIISLERRRQPIWALPSAIRRMAPGKNSLPIPCWGRAQTRRNSIPCASMMPT